MTARPDDPLLADLRRALQAARSPWADAPLARLHDKGLAHHHVRLQGSGVLARVPKQSQMGLGAADNLAYEAACYERAAASGHVPRVMGQLPVSPTLPRGALLVQESVGRNARLPEDLDAIAQALAAIHSLPLPAALQRAPLQGAADPLAALRIEIDAQAAFLDAAALQPAARAVRAAARRDVSITWCAKWRVLSQRSAHAGSDGEDWSAEHSSAALVAHVSERVDCYLGMQAIERVSDEIDALRRAFG
jgi:hypothetical protein